MDPVKERVIQHIKLAQILASKYFNIPGASREEVLSEAQTALVKASMAYQEDKGPFIPFAGTVIRNALNSLFKKQLRQVQMIGKSLDETIHGATKFGTYIGNLGQNIADTRFNVLQDVKKRERSAQLRAVIKVLSKKEELIISSIGKGMSLGEIGERLGVSKQAVFKVWCQARNKIKALLSNQTHSVILKTKRQ
jgi:RNA polymerase sigma factor (sigma-70 family)